MPIVNTPLNALPKRHMQALRSCLSMPAGTRLSVTWYEFPRASNFDKLSRERLRDVAAAAGFVAYRFGHPWVTEVGHAWAMEQDRADRVAAEISALTELKPAVPPTSGFGDSNADAIDAQILALKKRMSEEDVDRRFGMAAKNVHAAAMDAAEWLR